jgi:endonuclease G
MNKFLLTILAMATFIGGHSQTLRNKVTTGNDVFTVVYSEFLEQPLNVKYSITNPNGTASRKGMNFYKNDSIHTSDNDDYKYNEWDKGHMAPAADFVESRDKLYKTFSYLNSALQHKSLNRGEWKSLETFERLLWAEKGKVDVEIEIIFEPLPFRVEGGAAIPTAFKKHLVFKDGALCFFFPNMIPDKDGFEHYKIDCAKH